MVLYIYTACVEEKEFSITMDLNVASPEAMNADLKLTLDEISDSMLDHLRKTFEATASAGADGGKESTLMCSSCHTAPATRLVHHLLFFHDAQPPRVEDFPTPVCPILECEALSNGRHWLELESAASLEQGKKSNVGLPGCFFCHEKVTKAKRTDAHPSASNVPTTTTAMVSPSIPLLRCSRCHLARYCSVDCQRRDWPLHKRLCGEFVSS